MGPLFSILCGSTCIYFESGWGCYPYWLCSLRRYDWGCGRSGSSSSALGPLRFRGFGAMVFEDPTGSFLVVAPRAARTCQLTRAGVSPVDMWSTFYNVGWALISTFSGSQVDPESISVSVASVKVVGIIHLCATTLFHRCLPSFSLSTIPTLLGQRIFSKHGKSDRRMLFLPMRCFLCLC